MNNRTENRKAGDLEQGDLIRLHGYIYRIENILKESNWVGCRVSDHNEILSDIDFDIDDEVTVFVKADNEEIQTKEETKAMNENVITKKASELKNGDSIELSDGYFYEIVAFSRWTYKPDYVTFPDVSVYVKCVDHTELVEFNKEDEVNVIDSDDSSKENEVQGNLVDETADEIEQDKRRKAKNIIKQRIKEKEDIDKNLNRLQRDYEELVEKIQKMNAMTADEIIEQEKDSCPYITVDFRFPDTDISNGFSSCDF